MQCKELEAVVEQEGLSPLSLEAKEHLAGCPSCQDFVADLGSIVATAREFPAEVDPPQRVWVALRAQLEAEGIVREPEVQVHAESPSWWRQVSSLFQPRALAAAGIGVALVAAIAFSLNRHPVTPSGTPSSPIEVAKEKNLAPPATQAPATSKASAANQPLQAKNKPDNFLPSPSEDARLTSAAALGTAENDVPAQGLAGNAAVDAALRENLRTVNEFIAECEQHLKQFPQDQMAREYLNSAYQQKAELIAAMLDSGRSVQ